MKRWSNLVLTLVFVMVLALVIFVVSLRLSGWDTPQAKISLAAVAVAGAAAFLAALNDAYDLIGKLFGREQSEEPPVNGPRPNEESAIDAYLRWVVRHYGQIELRGIVRDGKQVVTLRLETAFVELEMEAFARPGEEGETGDRGLGIMPAGRGPGGMRPVDLKELLAVGDRLAITGGPGCGKTTVLLHLAHTLAVALSQKRPDLARQKLGLTGELPLPIFVPLSAYPLWLRRSVETATPAIQERTLAAFIAAHWQEQVADVGLPDNFLQQWKQAGRRVILLLDGLDEVANEEEQAEVSRAIEGLVDAWEGARVVVTCRTVAYKGDAVLGRAFRQVRVKPLDWEHIAALVRRAYDCILPQDRTEREKAIASLLAAIKQLEERRRQLGEEERLVNSPLLVRMLLVVHYSEGRELPQQRAEVYMKTADIMLRPEYSPEEKAWKHISRLVGGNWQRHRDVAQHIAFHLHSRGEAQGRYIEEESLRLLLEAQPEYAQLADALITLTRLRGTLLEERGGQYRFIHQAFQELLAARYLAEVERDEEKMVAFLEGGPVLDSWWREPALLLAGYLNAVSSPSAYKYLRRLAGIDEGAARRRPLSPDAQLAAAELAATALLELPQPPDELRAAMQQRVASFFEGQRKTLADARPKLRAAAGVALAHLGDTRPPVLDVDQMEFCLVPAGPFRMGSQEEEDEKPVHPVELPAYWIGRYPVTNAQFSAFVEAKGYEKEAYWGEAKAAGFWRPGEVRKWLWFRDKDEPEQLWQARPYDWGTPFALANHPAVGVTWYEALAFTHWLEERWQERGWLPAGWRIQLPSEAEWEKAARGGVEIPEPPVVKAVREIGEWASRRVSEWEENKWQERPYPWGDGWEDNRANTKEAGIQATSAPGCFPGGHSPYGVEEMSGNVWEWTRSLWGEAEVIEGKVVWKSLFEYPYEASDGRESLAAGLYWPRVLRGGSYYHDQDYCRCSFRDRNYPNSYGDLLGFRLVAASPFTSGL